MSRRLVRWVVCSAALAAALAATPAIASPQGHFADGIYIAPGALFTAKSPLAIADLEGAIDFLGQGPVLAIGYSYVARTTLHAIHAGAPIERAVLAGLPTRSPKNAAAMANLFLGRRVRTEEFIPYTEPELVASSSKPLLMIAGEKDPLVEPDEYRSRGIEPVILPGVNHFFSRRLGNEPPDPRDMALLCEKAIGFLL